MLINKSRCWTELNLCLYFNNNHLIYHKLLLGDKDTFKFAWQALRSSFHMIKRAAGSCGFMDASGNFVGNTMVQHDPAGQILFLHRNLQKWDCSDVFKKKWRTIRTFTPKAIDKNIIFDYHEAENTLYINLTGDILDQDFMQFFGELEEQCLTILRELRTQPFYEKFEKLNQAISR